MTEIGVVGLGLIGGSLALAARSAGYAVTAWDADPATRDQGLERGLIVRADMSDADLIVLAVPMPELTGGLATTLADVAISDAATINDVGSLKQPVADAMRAAGLTRRFVGGHPMAGSERRGFGAAYPDLFNGARWALCLDDDDTDLSRWFGVASMVIGLGAQVVPVLPAEHDTAMAMVSGVPHLLALALAASARNSGALVSTLAAGSFADLTRVAGSGPALLRAVTEQNERAVRAALRLVLDQLDRPWQDLIEDGHEARLSLFGGTPVDRPSLDAAAGVDARGLLALGRAGAVIESVDAATSTVWHRGQTPSGQK